MTLYQRVRDDRSGFALVATLMVMVLISVLIATATTGVLTLLRTSNLDYRNSRVFYASEAGAEAIMAQLADALDDGELTDAELAAITPPDLEGFEFDSLIVEKIGGLVTETITDGPYAGLYSLTQKIDIFARARDPMDNSSGIIVSAKAQAIPIFQFGVFFEKDLEATNGPSMTFAGWVHSNGNIYLSSNNAWYKDAVTTPNKVFHDRKDNHSVKNGVFIADAYGNDVMLDFDSRTIPDPNAFRAESDLKFDNRLKTDAYGVYSLKVPLPEGMDAIVVMQPRDPSDVEVVRKAKYSWKADWYIEVPLIAGLEDALCAPMSSIRSAGKVLPSIADCKNIFQWNWEQFFEARELRYADVLDIDVTALRAWVGANVTRSTQILYVTFTGTPPSSNLTEPRSKSVGGDGFYPIVRLINGRQLPDPLAVATDRAIYIQADYNSINWQPAAVIGDAINILSTAWDDAANNNCQNYAPGAVTLNNVCQNWIKRNAGNTQVWTAILAGHSATPCDHENAGCAGGSTDFYGGGIENYPRFLERWTGKTLTYRGSLVSLSESVFAVGTWNGRHYSPPQRDWMFDTRFEDPQYLPPGTPVVGNVIRMAFRPVY